MIIFQLNYNQCSIGTCHVIEEGHGILKFWLLFNYIITNGTLTHVTWAFLVHHQTKLFDVCHVYGFKILNLLVYWKCQHIILCHVHTYVTHLHDTWQLFVCKSSNICEVEIKLKNQLQGSWKQVEKILKISLNLCKLVEM
jgi:hypothetical protein